MTGIHARAPSLSVPHCMPLSSQGRQMDKTPTKAPTAAAQMVAQPLSPSTRTNRV